MKYARRAARWLTLFGAFNPWRGATWALDGSGRAYNVPTLGSELLTDGGLENWTSATNLTNWTEGAAGASTVTQSTDAYAGTYSALLTSDGASNSVSVGQSISTSVGTWVLFEFAAKANVSGKFLATDYLSVPFLQIGTTWRLYQWSGQLAVASQMNIKRASASAAINVDALTLKQLAIPTLIAALTGTASTQTAAARIHTLTTGTQAGVASLIDSASNPQNFLIGYHDGTNVKLDKRVGGTYTSLISTAVAFSSNAQIEIRRPSGNTFQLWYNGVQRGTDQTVSDAGIISNTIYGLFSTYEGNLFSEFTLDGAVIPFLFPAPAPTFAPTLLADLWAWYDASDISSLYQDSGRTTPVATNGDPVGSWGDKSGNARHGNQAGASTIKPTYATGVQNGRAGALFDGGDYLDTVATVNSFPLTIVGVARTSATIGTTRGLVSSRNSTTFGARQYIASANNLITQIDTPIKTITSAASVAADTTFLFASRFGTTLISQTLNATTEDDTHAAAATANIVSLGRLNVNTTTSLTNGHLLEVVIYNRALTADELTQVQTYLNTKWAVY